LCSFLLFCYLLHEQPVLCLATQFVLAANCYPFQVGLIAAGIIGIVTTLQ